jgi:hypothetical protein
MSVLLGKAKAEIHLDMDAFMRNAAKAEQAMNRLNESLGGTRVERESSAAEVAAIQEELTKAGFDPAVMQCIEERGKR